MTLLPGQTLVNGVSNFLFGSNCPQDYSNPPGNTVRNTAAIQAQARAGGFTLMRWAIPADSADSYIDLTANASIACGCAMLVILTHNNPTWNQHLVTYLGARCNLYEYSNEPDISGITSSQYLSYWNAEIPVLRGINSGAAFIGPVLGVYANVQSYLVPWLQGAVSAGTTPDGVSYHIYPCTGTTSSTTCAPKYVGMANTVSQMNTTVSGIVGHTLPLCITEWNIDASNPPQAYTQDQTFTTTWTHAAIDSMATTGLAMACQFDFASNAGGGPGYDDLVSTQSPFSQRPQYQPMVDKISQYLGGSTPPHPLGVLPGQIVANGVSNFVFGVNAYGESLMSVPTPTSGMISEVTSLSPNFSLLMRYFIDDTATDAQIQAKLHDVQVCGGIPLCCLQSPGNATFNQHVISLYGSSVLLYEFGNEPDGPNTPMTVGAFSSAWNAQIPVLRGINPQAAFLGGGFGGWDSYGRTWLANCATSGVLPDGITSHLYACSTIGSSATCLTHTGDYGTQVTQMISDCKNALGRTLPVGITEWNVDFHSPMVSYAHTEPFSGQYYMQVLQSMISAGAAIACQFAMFGNSGNFNMIDDGSGAKQEFYSDMQAAIVALAPSFTPPPPPPPTTIPHICFIPLENTSYNNTAAKYVLGNTTGYPKINTLLNTYGYATKFFATSHDSLPNYLAITGGLSHDTLVTAAGSVPGDSYDPSVANAAFKENTFVDSLAKQGIAWKHYAEDLPSVGYLGGDGGGYIRHHNPWVYYASIRGNANQFNNIVPYTQLTTDLNAGTAPPFFWVQPNSSHNTHSGTQLACDTFVNNLVMQIQASTWYTQHDGQIVLWWDETDPKSDTTGVAGSDANPGGGQVMLIVINAKNKGITFDNTANHYGLLHALEDLYGLSPYLNDDAHGSNGYPYALFSPPTKNPGTTRLRDVGARLNLSGGTGGATRDIGSRLNLQGSVLTTRISDIGSRLVLTGGGNPPPPGGGQAFYLSTETNTVLTTAGRLYTTPGTPFTTSVIRLVGTGTGYGELASFPIMTPWPGTPSIGSPTGYGYIFPTQQLTGRFFGPGTMSATISLTCVQGQGTSLTNGGMLGADLYMRVYKYDGFTDYIPVTTLSLPGQLLVGVPTNFTLSGTLASEVTFASLDQLYLDIWVNVTQNANNVPLQNIQISNLSLDTVGKTGSSFASLTFPTLATPVGGLTNTYYLSNAPSSTIATASQLYVTSGTPNTNWAYNRVGTATGYGEVTSQGTIAAWAASGSIGSPTGKGFLYEISSLAGTTFPPGTFSANLRLSCAQNGDANAQKGTLGADLYTRVYKYNGGTYTLLSTLSSLGQTLPAIHNTNFALTGSLATTVTFVSGDHLYLDIWPKVTSNANGSSVQDIRLGRLSVDTLGFTGDNGGSLTFTASGGPPPPPPPPPAFSSTPIGMALLGQARLGDDSMVITRGLLKALSVSYTISPSKYFVALPITYTIMRANVASLLLYYVITPPASFAINGDSTIIFPDRITYNPRPVTGRTLLAAPIIQGYRIMNWQYTAIEPSNWAHLISFYNPASPVVTLTYPDETGTWVQRAARMLPPIWGSWETMLVSGATLQFVIPNGS